MFSFLTSLANAQYNRQRRSGPNFSNIERDRWNALSDLKEYAALLPDDQDVQDILSKALSQTTPDPFAPQTFPPLETMPTIDFDGEYWKFNSTRELCRGLTVTALPHYSITLNVLSFCSLSVQTAAMRASVVTLLNTHSV